MALSLTLYGSTDCDDTERTRLWLEEHGVHFCEVNIDHDAEAERFVIFINRGYRSTPTLVFGEGKRQLVLTEPTDDELAAALAEFGDG
ncbi:MAG: glutaredoxin family protein [Caldilineales bacterium]|nr:glutaredoxin family protein [Caldilineales bacterium]